MCWRATYRAASTPTASPTGTFPVTQLNTDNGFGGECHLDANMVRTALGALPLAELDVLIIENVGNLVCPAEFHVGADARIMICSVTEGEDKPLKYPLMFRACELVIINKIDLLPHLDYDIDRLQANIAQINPTATTMRTSARTGDGIDAFRHWLARLPARTKPPPDARCRGAEPCGRARHRVCTGGAMRRVSGHRHPGVVALERQRHCRPAAWLRLPRVVGSGSHEPAISYQPASSTVERVGHVTQGCCNILRFVIVARRGVSPRPYRAAVWRSACARRSSSALSCELCAARSSRLACAATACAPTERLAPAIRCA